MTQAKSVRMRDTPAAFIGLRFAIVSFTQEKLLRRHEWVWLNFLSVGVTVSFVNRRNSCAALVPRIALKQKCFFFTWQAILSKKLTTASAWYFSSGDLIWLSWTAPLTVPCQEITWICIGFKKKYTNVRCQSRCQSLHFPCPSERTRPLRWTRVA